MALKIKKCHFFSDAVYYLKDAIAPGRLHVASETRETINDLDHSTNTTEQRSILGMCNVYRRFVPNLARKAATLNKLLKIGALTKWDLENYARTAVDELNQNRIEPPKFVLLKDQRAVYHRNWRLQQTGQKLPTISSK